MTREERLEIVNTAFDRAMREMEGRKEFPRFRDQCMRAIIGAAVFLDRDPVALAELLADGRLAEYVEVAEGTLPLSLDDPAPVRESMEDLLREAAGWVETERDQLERRAARMLKRLDRAADEYRTRAHQIQGWRAVWADTRRWLRYGEDWVRRRGLAGRLSTSVSADGE